MNNIPLSLYIDLHEGTVADLEVVAKTALAWDALIKEVFFIIDPSLDIKVEMVNGTEGSLSLNAIIKAISKVTEDNPKTAGAIAGILAIFISVPIQHASEHFWEDVYEIIGHKDETDEEESHNLKKGIDKDISIAIDDNVAPNQKKNLFAEAYKDPAIRGIGVTIRSGKKPKNLVPREEFQNRVNKEEIIKETVERQTVYKTKSVTLIRPVLKAQAAMWRFREASGNEFSAKMKDPDYIEALESKRTGIQLAIGIEMLIEFEYKQENENGQWVDEEISVRRVLSPRAGPSDQKKLF